MIQELLSTYPYLFLILILGLIVLYESVTITKGNEFITLELKWFGKEMPDGRTIALSHEVGVQARLLGPGFHLLTPFIYKTKKCPFLIIPKNQVGLVRAMTGAPIPASQFMAKTAECDLFQVGEAFLKNGGEKGPQLDILPEGQYKINPFLFEVNIVDATMIGDDEC